MITLLLHSAPYHNSQTSIIAQMEERIIVIVAVPYLPGMNLLTPTLSLTRSTSYVGLAKTD